MGKITPTVAAMLLVCACWPAHATGERHQPQTAIGMADDAVAKARSVMMSDPAKAYAIGVSLERDLGALPESRGRTIAMSRAHWIAGEAQIRLGHMAEAHELNKSALTDARSVKDAQTTADALLSRGSMQHQQGDPAGALRDYLEASTLFQKVGNARSQSIALQYLGNLYEEATDYERAGRYMEMAGRLYPDEPRMNIALLNAMGGLALKTGRFDKALYYFDRGSRLSRGSGETALEARSLMNKATALVKLGDIAKAAAIVERSKAIARRAGSLDKGDYAQLDAIIAARSGQLARAVAIERANTIKVMDNAQGEQEEQFAYEVFKMAGLWKEAAIHLERADALRRKMTALAVSNQAALMATKYDYASQELRIAKLQANEMRRRMSDEHAAASTQRSTLIAGGCVAYVLIAFLTFGIIVLRRRRDQVREINVELATTNQALELAIAEVQERSEAEHHAMRLAEHDTLTSLPNRRHLQARLNEDFRQSCGMETNCAILLLDLDRFKGVNDTFGHAVGDGVLVEASRRLTEIATRHDAMTVRLGGDEFLMVLMGQCHEDVPETMAKEIIDSIGQPYDIAGHRLSIGTSIGIARYATDGKTVDALLRAADIAMYEAKRFGRNTYRFYDEDIDAKMRDRTLMGKDLRVAIDNQQIEAHFQPIHSFAENRIVGFEALARWNHATRGQVSPDVFIPIAEETAMIGDLTIDILRQSCRAALDWPDDVSVSVNISPVLLRDEWMLARTFGVLHEEGLPPRRLIIEITETAVIDDLDMASETIDAFRESGIRVALDDFGKGYSSLTHLKRLRFDTVKLDASFTSTLHEPDSMKITTAVAGLAQAMEVSATAEGVEDEKTADLLRELGFTYGQGYLFGRPAPRVIARSLFEAVTTMVKAA